jgi:hypothetical protein
MQTALLSRMGLLVIVSCVAATAASAQVPPAAAVIPPGFKIEVDKQYGEAMMAEAVKPNTACPKAHTDPQIHIGYSWQPNPAAEQTVQIIAQQPEDPPSQTFPKTEPAGKGSHRGGVLIWQKTTMPWIGSGKAPDLVTIGGAWVGSFGGGLLGVSVNRLCGSKEEALAWLDGMLDKVIGKK